MKKSYFLVFEIALIKNNFFLIFFFFFFIYWHREKTHFSKLYYSYLLIKHYLILSSILSRELDTKSFHCDLTWIWFLMMVKLQNFLRSRKLQKSHKSKNVLGVGNIVCFWNDLHLFPFLRSSQLDWLCFRFFLAYTYLSRVCLISTYILFFILVLIISEIPN